MDIHIFQDIFDGLNQAITQVLAGGITNVIELFTPLIMAIFGSYVMLILFSYMRGHGGEGGEPIMDFFFRMVGWGMILSMGANATYYSSTIAPFVMDLGSTLSQAISSNHVSKSGNGMDELIQSYIDFAINTYKNASGIKSTLFSIFIIAMTSVTGIVFTAICAANIVLAQVALGITVVVGPIMFYLALFPACRSFLHKWTAQCANYALLTVVVNVGATLLLTFINAHMPSQGADIGLTSALLIFFMNIVFIYVAKLMPDIAQGLAGGIGISARMGDKAHSAAMNYGGNVMNNMGGALKEAYRGIKESMGSSGNNIKPG